jgi:hypothetical protein
MTTVTEDRAATVGRATARPAGDSARTGGTTDWVLTGLCAWVVGGAYLDVWAHSHLRLLESFLTPWHAVLYSGMLATTAALLVVRRRQRAAGIPWEPTSGYGLSLMGCALFVVSGAADAAWHTILGVETGLRGLISPPHILLTVSAGLVVSGPLRIAWRRDGERAPWPAVISAALVLSALTFLTQFDHPLSNLWAAGTAPPAVLGLPQDAMELGVLGVLVQGGLFVGLVLVLLSRFRLPPGSLTVILGINGFLVTAVDDPSAKALVAVVMGLAGDLLLLLLSPSTTRPWRLRVFAALWPATAFALYFLWVLATWGIWWPVHLWTGTVLMAGAAGWLLSHLLVPAGHAAAREAAPR